MRCEICGHDDANVYVRGDNVYRCGQCQETTDAADLKAAVRYRAERLREAINTLLKAGRRDACGVQLTGFLRTLVPGVFPEPDEKDINRDATDHAERQRQARIEKTPTRPSFAEERGMGKLVTGRAPYGHLTREPETAHPPATFTAGPHTHGV